MNVVIEISNILQICSWLGTLVIIHISLKTAQQMLLSERIYSTIIYK